MYLLQCKSRWRLVPLDYDIDCSGPSLLHMIVKGAGSQFDAVVRHHPVRVRPQAMPGEFDLGDPMEYGRAQALRASAASSSAGAPAVHRGGDVDEDIFGDFDELGLYDLEADEQEDILDLLAEGRAIPFVLEEDLPESFSHLEIGHADLAAGDALDEHVAAEAPLPSDAPAAAEGIELVEPPPLPPTPQLCADASEIDPEGRVFCPIGVFALHKPAGRITVFPKGVPLEKQNVAIRCFLHTGCSFTRKRIRFTDRQLLVWLFSGSPWELGETAVQSKASKADHALKALTML